MSGLLWLDWAVLAVSLFNTLALLWLGLTVLLNAERRNWGIWLTGGGLLVGGAFFLSHSAILALGVYSLSAGLELAWHAGWITVILTPLAWYAAMLWYSGYWEARPSPIYRRHRYGLAAVLGISLVILALLLFANPLPSFRQIASLNLSAALSVGGIPLLVLSYPLYLLACLGLALEAVLHPGPAARPVSQAARLRARPWLSAASLLLLGVSLLVGWVMVWLVTAARQHSLDAGVAGNIARFDLLISVLIASSVVMVGQAIVAYEVFTGKSLPRQGLRRYWQRALILAGGYGGAISASLVLGLPPIYSLLLSTLLLVVFFALLSWRAFAERERTIAQLQPFVSSQGLYDQILSEDTPELASANDVKSPFTALCEQILGSSRAHLVPMGWMAPLFGPALNYPEHLMPPPEPLYETIRRLASPGAISIPLNELSERQIAWAVPLWSHRGLTGVLLLGDKRDGGLYSQEEMEIARSAGERLVDSQASAEMARRLVAIQRQRMVEIQVLDRQARRALHDDILPQLHTAMLALSRGEEGEAEAMQLLGEAHHAIANLLRDMPGAHTTHLSRLGFLQALRELVEVEMKGAFDQVSWQVEVGAEAAARSLSPLKSEVLFYAAREGLRNAANHGRGASPQPLLLQVQVSARSGLQIEIEDNGVGIGEGQEQSGGSGQGLALHSTLLAVIGGTLSVESQPGSYTRLTLSLPDGKPG